MPEDLATIAREAKTLHQTLKELLKSKEPYDRDVEFQRKNLRKRHLTLLLLHPGAKESKDVETALWMQTSYAFISAYKQRITAIDRATQANVVPRQSDGSKQQNQKHHSHGPVEYRKLLQRFRQFLAEEEKFWIQLVLRMHRAFDLTEADEALTALGLFSDTTTADGSALFPQGQVSTALGEKGSQLSTMSKALICLGDIARYRELYNESVGRPKAGQEAGAPARRGKIRRKGAPGIEAAPMARNYDRAQLRYEQARLLVPSEGNASHQLAIVATYLPDALVALMHYYRSLCVKQPYEPAADNMVTHITKTLQQWNRSRQERERILASPPVSIQNQVDILKNRLVILHACWQKNMERETKEQERRVSDDFQRLVGERNLPSDLISTVIVVSQGGLWKHRMIRDGNTNAQSRREVARTPEANTILEWRIYHHLLDMHMALLDVGKHELKDVPPLVNIDSDLAQRITAAFRRTLPALRIASKWLRGNLNYMMQDPEFKSQQQKARLRGGKVLHKTRGKLSGDSTHTIRFWNRYCQFVTALARAFPEAHLTLLSHPLEEDIDMRGFLPLKKMMGEGMSAKDRLSEAHPNEEQLMRISDLLSDAKALASMEDSPLLCENGVYQLKQSMIETPSRPPENGHTPHGNSSDITPPVPNPPSMEEFTDSISPATLKEEDAMTEVTSRTDDDIVNEAFKHVGFGAMDDDEDDDQIVWNPKASSPALSPLIQASPITPVKSAGATVGNGHSAAGLPQQSVSPKQALKTPIGSPRAVVHPVTAQDLLQNVMSVGGKPGASIGALESPRVAPLLFGSDLSNQASIWSASRDEQLKFAGGPNQLGIQTSPRSFPHTLNAPHETLSTTSTWSSQTMHTPSASFQIPGNMHHQTSYPSSLSPLQNGTPGLSQHHRVSSLSHSHTPYLSPHKQYGGGNIPFSDPAIQPIAPPVPQFQHPETSLHQTSAPQHSPIAFAQHQQHSSAGLNQYYDAPLDLGYSDGYSGGYPSHPSLHDRARSASQSYMTSALWGKIG